MPRPRKVSFEDNSAGFALINFNFSDVHAKARGLYVSSGDVNQVNYMIDDQPATAYQFASDDAAPTAVIDLGRERNLSPPRGHLCFATGQYRFLCPTWSTGREIRGKFFKWRRRSANS